MSEGVKEGKSGGVKEDRAKFSLDILGINAQN